MDLTFAPRREATFSSLPANAKYVIIHQLHFGDLRNSRLVSKEWFHIVNSCPTYQQQFNLHISDQNGAWATELFSSFNEDAAFVSKLSQAEAEQHVAKGMPNAHARGTDNDTDDDEDNTLQPIVLPSPCINHLTVSSLSEPIPIYSSSRSRIPKSKVLSLYAGISRDNLARLLQYQVPSARQLFLHDLSLASLVNLSKDGHLLGPHRNWSILVRFSFVFWYAINKSTFLDFENHVLVLGQLLAVIDTPKLRTLIASIDFPKQHEGFHGRMKVHSMEQLSRDFNQQLAAFVTKWGHQLSRFYLTIRGINVLPVLQTFGYFVNVRRLKFCLRENDSALKASDVLHSIRAFTRLTTLLVSLPPEFGVEAQMTLLRNNQSTLSMLEMQHWVTSLDWIFAPVKTQTPAEKSLQYMEFRWKIQGPGAIQDWLMDLKLDAKNVIPYYSMRRLKLFLHFDHDYDTGTNREAKSLDPNFSSQLARCISRCMPNLSHIELISTNTLITDLIDVPKLISRLKFARRVDVHDRWKKLHKKIPLYELEKWCEGAEDIQGAWINDYSFYRIDIMKD